MDRNTGASLALARHITQSLADIITTPLGSRVMRRTYGSLVPFLIDQPDNGNTAVRFTSAVASAVMQWEPRVKLTRVAIAHDAKRPGFAEIQLRGMLLTAAVPQPLNLAVQVRSAA